MAGRLFDVWLHELPDTPPGAAARAIARQFGVELVLAQQLAAALPCHVRRGVSFEEAQRFAATLTAIGGRVEVSASGAEPATRVGAVQDTGATLKVGTFTEPGLPAPPQAASRAPPQAVSPAPLPQPELAAPEVLIPAPRPGNAASGPVAFLPASAPAPAPIALQKSVATSSHDSLRLPSSDAPPPIPMRSPASRARPPRPSRKESAATGALSDVDPLKVTAGILREARSGTLQDALRGHPIAGFVLVVSGTLLAFLALYAMVPEAADPKHPNTFEAPHPGLPSP